MMRMSSGVSQAGAMDGRRWQFASLADAEDPVSEPQGGSASGVDPGSGKDRARIALAEAHKHGLEEGFRAGSLYEKRELAANIAKIAALIASVQAQFRAMDTEVAEALMKLSFSLARQILQVELSVQPELVRQSVKDALASLSLRATYPTIHLHPHDLALIQSDPDASVAERGCRLVADATLSRGGCRLESALSEVDATIESRWSRALQNMGYNDRDGVDVRADQ